MCQVKQSMQQENACFGNQRKHGVNQQKKQEVIFRIKQKISSGLNPGLICSHLFTRAFTLSWYCWEVSCLTQRTGTLTTSCHTALHSVFQSFIANPLFLTVCSFSYGPEEIIFVLNAVRKALRLGLPVSDHLRRRFCNQKPWRKGEDCGE